MAMKRAITFLVTIIICIGFFTVSLAQEKDEIKSIFFVSKEAKAKLKKVQTIAIFLNGNDSLRTRIGEDVLSINLANAGFTVISRETLEKAVGEQIAKKRKGEIGGVVNALEIGRIVNADVILIGTVIIESQKEKLFSVSIASFQLVDVLNGKTLINIFFESKEGISFTKIAKKVVAILKQNIG